MLASQGCRRKSLNYGHFKERTAIEVCRDQLDPSKVTKAAAIDTKGLQCHDN